MVKVNDKNDDMQFHGFGPQSSMSSDGSFVVLERSPPQGSSGQFSVCPSIFPPSNIISGQQQPESQSSSFIPGSMPSDLSPEEIQKKLHEVLQENVELKETLHQNNLAMKQQFNTLVMWQDEVFKVHQSHKEKFAETKDLILKLRAENAELRKYLEQSKVGGISDVQLKAENASLKGQIAELQQKLTLPSPWKDHPSGTPSRKEQELSELAEQLNRQLETAERARHQLIVDVERLTAQKTRLERTVAALQINLDEQKGRTNKLQEEQDNLLHTMAQKQDLRDYVVVQQNKVSQGIGAEEVQRLKTELRDQRTHVEALQQQLLHEREVNSVKEITTKQTPSQPTSVTPDDRTFIASNLKGCEEKLQQFNTSLGKQSERYASWDSWLQVATENVCQFKGLETVEPQTINNLRLEINELRKLLSQEQVYGEEKKQNLAQAQAQFQALHTDYQSLLQEWESYNADQEKKNTHNSAYYDVQARGFREKLDGLTAQLLCKDEELTMKTKEITQLSEKIKKLTVENETITILKAQVEVYQSDFNAEREARENLAGEKERLSEDLRHLQRRNQDLLENQATYQQSHSQQLQTIPTPNNGWNTIATAGRGTSNDRSPRQSVEHNERPQRFYDEDVPAPKQYHCPKCNMAFRQYNLLQYHVETCLELVN